MEDGGCLSLVFRCLLDRGGQLVYGRRRYALVLHADDERALPADFAQRFAYYLPGWRYRTCRRDEKARRFHLGWFAVRDAVCRQSPILRMDNTWSPERDFSYKLARNRQYFVNPRTNPIEAWEWQRVVHECTGHTFDHEGAKSRLADYIERQRLRAYGKCYVFGTGPSLALAEERDWSDGTRIVCNTIVRDAALWAHLKPHIIVAADAAYHFGFTAFARAFRNDLRARLQETDTLFIYPAQFDACVVREFGEFRDRLVPIPSGSHTDVGNNLLERFEFAALDNVLTYLLVVACTISNTVMLWGFDGRAPGDQLFWRNSTPHTYPELMDSLKHAYPAFFEHYVPTADKGKYTRIAFGDKLEASIAAAEAQGKRFVMMHKSWTPTLQKRFPGSSSTMNAPFPG